MTLNNDQIKTLAKGGKLKFKATRGKNKNTTLIFDQLAGAVAVVCIGNEEGITNTQAHLKLLESEFANKYPRKISRAMVAARMQKLWDIKFMNRREEPIIIEGREEGKRYVYHMGAEEDISLVQTELIMSGQFTRKFFNRVFRDVYDKFRPDNPFDEAILDLIIDTSEMQFPATLAKYREHCIESFREELSREHRVIQLEEWLRAAFPTATAMSDDIGINLIVKNAKVFTEPVWKFVEDQMRARQKLMASNMNFNEAEYKRLTEQHPDFWKSVKEMKKEGKL